MTAFVCKHCGAPDLYETGEVTVDASRGIEIVERDGKIVAVPDSHHDIDGTTSDFNSEGYACASCQEHAGRIEDIAVPESTDDLLAGCCCGHPSGSHSAPNARTGRRHCTETACGCWDYETDPALASVVRERGPA